MKRVNNPYFYIMLLSVAGLVGIFTIRTMDMSRTETREGVAMDTLVKLSITGSKSRAELSSILDEAFASLVSLEKKLSMYNPNSQLSRINQSAGRTAESIDGALFDLLSHSLELAALTDRAFDPTIGAVTALWKSHREGTAASTPTLPSAEEIRSAAAHVNADALKLDPPNEAFLGRRGMMLDLGAVGKGYASRVLRDLLGSHGVSSALIDLGGNIVAAGCRPDGSAWRIGVQDPQKPRGTPLLSLEICSAAVVTSGIYERRWEIEGKTYTHIFDPRTGLPVEGDLQSVTVVTQDPVEGDALATAFMVMGAARSLDLLRVIPGVDAIFVSVAADGAGTVVATGGLKGSLRLLSDAYRLVYHDVL